jgi:hypothetical protein
MYSLSLWYEREREYVLSLSLVWHGAVSMYVLSLRLCPSLPPSLCHCLSLSLFSAAAFSTCLVRARSQWCPGAGAAGRTNGLQCACVVILQCACVAILLCAGGRACVMIGVGAGGRWLHGKAYDAPMLLGRKALGGCVGGGVCVEL